MRKFYVVFVCLIVSLCATSAPAQEKKAKPTANSDQTRIESLFQAYMKAFNAKDTSSIMANYAPGNHLFVFDVVPPREFAGWDAYKKDWEGLFAAFPGPIENKMSDLSITVVGPFAYAHNIQTVYFTRKDGTRLDLAVRVTDVLRKVNGKWLIVQEHVSVPVDINTGKADLMSKP